MANAVRKICTKIGNGHQYYLLAAPKASAYVGHLVSDAVQQRPTDGVQNEKKCKLYCVANEPCCKSYVLGKPIVKKRSVPAAAVEWFNGRKTGASFERQSAVSPLTRLNGSAIKPDTSYKSTSSNDNDSSDPKGLPSAEQLEYVFNRLAENLPTLFKQNLDFSLFHPKLVFENNIRGTKTVGLEYFMSTISLLRLMGHIKYAFVKLDILKITKHPEDGTIKIRWRIKGISGMKVFMKFWKFRFWNMEQVIKENVETWHDGFSVFYLKSDGLVHKLTADKMQPDNDPVVEDKSPLATKLALFLGLSPQLNNLDCLMSFDSEQANELFKMVVMSLEEVV